MTGAELIAARKTLGYTQAQMAARIGASLQTIWRFERRKDADLPGTAATAVSLLLQATALRRQLDALLAPPDVEEE